MQPEVMTLIGIDPGVHTGFAVMRKGKLDTVQAVTACKAEEMVLKARNEGPVFVFFEDARMRQWFGQKGREALQGAGSIKRDCSRWQEFLEYHDIPHSRVAPRANRTKLKAAQFKAITGWDGATNEHGRDAAMLVFGRNFLCGSR